MNYSEKFYEILGIAEDLRGCTRHMPGLIDRVAIAVSISDIAAVRASVFHQQIDCPAPISVDDARLIQLEGIPLVPVTRENGHPTIACHGCGQLSAVAGELAGAKRQILAMTLAMGSMLAMLNEAGLEVTRA